VSILFLCLVISYIKMKVPYSCSLLLSLQYGIAELFLRVVHFRDADVQSMVTVSQNNDYRYLYPPQVC